MSRKLVQINFKYAVSLDELEQGAAQAVRPIQESPGFIWKIWIYNDQDKICGGIYLFADEASAQAYVDGPVVEQLRNTPAFEGFSVRQFDIMETLSAATDAPV